MRRQSTDSMDDLQRPSSSRLGPIFAIRYIAYPARKSLICVHGGLSPELVQMERLAEALPSCAVLTLDFRFSD